MRRFGSGKKGLATPLLDRESKPRHDFRSTPSHVPRAISVAGQDAASQGGWAAPREPAHVIPRRKQAGRGAIPKQNAAAGFPESARRPRSGTDDTPTGRNAAPAPDLNEPRAHTRAAPQRCCRPQAAPALRAARRA